MEIGKFQIANILHASSPYIAPLTTQDPLSGIVRTEPRNDVDHQLLEHMKRMTKDCEPIGPAAFPLKFVRRSHLSLQIFMS